MPLHHVRVVSFDADNTLWDFTRVMRRSLGFVLAELQAAHPHTAADVTIDGMVAARQAVARESKGRGKTLTHIRTDSFRRVLQDIGVDDSSLATQLDDTYFRHRYGDIELYDDVLPTLRALGERYTLGIVSNGNSYPKDCGLDGVFAFAIFAEDHGVEKPDPAMFHHACTAADCAPREVLHIGDSLEEDVAGAQAAGVRNAWLNRSSTANTSAIQPEFEVDSLARLPVMLGLAAIQKAPSLRQRKAKGKGK